MTTDAHTDRPDNGGSLTIRTYFERWLLDMEKFNNERHVADKEAVAAALQAAKDVVVAALTAAKEAVAKQENAQTAYNLSHNDLLRKMDEQHKETLPRPEAEGRFTRQDEKIEDLKKEIGSLRETRAGDTTSKVQLQWLIATFIAAVPTVLIIFDLLSRKAP